MTRAADRFRQELEASHPEFRRLSEEHVLYSRLLGELTRKAALSPAEQEEAARLKKLKLQAKDRMEEMLRDYRRQEAEAVEAT